METIKLVLAFWGKTKPFEKQDLPNLGRFRAQTRPVRNPTVFLFFKSTKISVPPTPNCTFANHNANE